MEAIWIPIIALLVTGAVIILPSYFKSQDRQRIADALRVSIERGDPLPTELVAALAGRVKPAASPDRDLRTGIIWIGIAFGIAVMGVVMGVEEPDATYPMLGIAAFPGFVGLAFVVLGLINRKKS